MLQPIDVTQARNNFSDLLGQVYYGGQRFVIQKLGRPFAVLTNFEEYQNFQKARGYFFRQIKAERAKNKGIPLSQVQKDVGEAIAAVRRDKNKK